MKKININVYNYDELEKEIQDKLYNEEIECEKDFYCETMLYNDMEDKASDLLREYFNNDNGLERVFYDLSYCQGSGSMIEFSINIEDLNNKYHILTDEELRFIKDYGIMENINVKHYGNYSHEYSFIIDYTDNFGYYDYDDIKDNYNISEKDFNKIEDKIINLCDTYNIHNNDSQFITDIVCMNKDLTKYGYDLLENEDNFKEGVIMSLEERLYLKNGEIFDTKYQD